MDSEKNTKNIVGSVASSMDESSAMEMDTETTTAATQTQTSATLPETSNRAEELKSLVTLARHFLNQGKPSLAYQAVITALRTAGGEEAVLQTLHRARELYRNKMQATAAADVDELASLFAECAIAEAHSTNLKPLPYDSGGPYVASDLDGNSILAKTGRAQIMLDACIDGSSFVCLQCGGLVSKHRREEHFAYWCCKI